MIPQLTKDQSDVIRLVFLRYTHIGQTAKRGCHTKTAYPSGEIQADLAFSMNTGRCIESLIAACRSNCLLLSLKTNQLILNLYRLFLQNFSFSSNIALFFYISIQKKLPLLHSQWQSFNSSFSLSQLPHNNLPHRVHQFLFRLAHGNYVNRLRDNAFCRRRLDP